MPRLDHVACTCVEQAEALVTSPGQAHFVQPAQAPEMELLSTAELLQPWPAVQQNFSAWGFATGPNVRAKDGCLLFTTSAETAVAARSTRVSGAKVPWIPARAESAVTQRPSRTPTVSERESPVQSSCLHHSRADVQCTCSRQYFRGIRSNALLMQCM